MQYLDQGGVVDNSTNFAQAIKKEFYVTADTLPVLLQQAQAIEPFLHTAVNENSASHTLLNYQIIKQENLTIVDKIYI